MSIQYKIVSPMNVNIMGDSVIDAIKRFVKMNYELEINNLILQDEGKRMYARIRYFEDQNKHKVGIDVYPTLPVNIQEPSTVELNVPMHFQGNSGLNLYTQPYVNNGEVNNMFTYSYPGYKK
jgi:hypothetical protein